MTRISSILLALFVVPPAHAEINKRGRDNMGIAPSVLTAPDAKFFANEEALLKASSEKSSSDGRRRLVSAGSRTTGSEDLMTSELKAFRDKLVKSRHAEQLELLLREHDSKYDTLPNDLKYVIARLSPLIVFRGFFWRMATLAHQAVVTQEVLLTTVRAFAEQVTIFEPETQWQAYMSFFAIPSPRNLKAPGAHADGIKRPDSRFYVENDLVDFLAGDVYGALSVANERLARLQTTVEVGGKPAPIIFDNRIRFGENAFGQAYDAADRFSVIGEAERLAAMARFHRRMATISQLAAYDMNGNIALRREIGKKFGIDVTLSAIGGDEALNIEGLTRVERVEIARRHGKLFTLRSKDWMQMAYRHLSRWAELTGRAWEIIRNNRENHDMLLDPDLFMGRKEQIDGAIANMRRLFPDSDKATVAVLHGAISGDELRVDMKSFFFNPPADLKALMPTRFNRHEDIEPLKRVYGDGNLKIGKKSTVAMRLYLDGKKKDVVWRNYLFGRATGWDPTAYAQVFPGVASPADVARAQRILGETRGARPLLNTLAVFIK